MKTLRDMATLTSEQPTYTGGAVRCEFECRSQKIMRPKDAEAATLAMLERFRDILKMNGVTRYAWPPQHEVIPHSDFQGFKGVCVTLASEPTLAKSIGLGVPS